MEMSSKNGVKLFVAFLVVLVVFLISYFATSTRKKEVTFVVAKPPAIKQGILVKDANTSDWKIYKDSLAGFQIKYPVFLNNTAKQKLATDDVDGLDANSLKISFPENYQQGTNLRGATIFVGAKQSDESECYEVYGDVLGSNKKGDEEVSLAGVKFKKISVSDAGAGNVYLTSRYASYQKGKCMMLSLVTHSGNLEIMRESDKKVYAYDQILLSQIFDKIVSTLTI